MRKKNRAGLGDELIHHQKFVSRGRQIITTLPDQSGGATLPADPRVARLIEPIRPVSDVLKVKGVRRNRISAVSVLKADRRRR